VAWIKIPKENHQVFRDALPLGVATLNMFGGVAAKVNGHMAAGLFAHSAVVKVSADDQAKALALDGAARFDPMGNGRIMADTIMLPEDVFGDREQLREWLQRAVDYCASIPAKSAKKAKPRPAKVAAAPKRAAAKKPAAKPIKKKPAAKKKKR
jgi:TfoX/Sxy family transcriptional regulator of competence genes